MESDLLKPGGRVLDATSSARLDILRFPLIVGVVFIHAYGANVGLSGGSVGVETTGDFVRFVQDLVSAGLAQIAVPLFFLMSGYLFFFGFQWSWPAYRAKIQSRLHTLLVPFLFWNLATLGLLALAQSLPATQGFFSGKNALIAGYGVFDYVNAIFGLQRFPVSYQFWFVRDLMVLVLAVPLVHVVLVHVPRLFLAGMLGLWFLDLWPLYVPSGLACTFFYAGAYWGRSGANLFALDRLGARAMLAYPIVLLVDTATRDLVFNPWLHKAGVLLGIAAALCASRLVVERARFKAVFLWASSASFFVFAVHEPLLTILKKISYKLVQPETDLAVLVLYFALPAVAIGFSLLLHTGLRSVAPTFLRVISGAR